MEKGVAITGMGVISSIGNNVEENYRALLNGQHGIGYPQVLQTSHDYLPVGEIKISNKVLAEQLGLRPGHSLTRAALLGAIAAQEAIQQAGLTTAQLEETAFISGNSVGGMDMTEEYFTQFPESPKHHRFIQAQHPGFTTTQIAKHINTRGFISTISTACSSSANAIIFAVRMIKAGKAKRVVVGGTDCLTRFTLNGFNSLMILSREPCQPFDEHRSGLNLGEGAAYLVLEAGDVRNGKPVLGEITGYGNANDAYHQTASSEKGDGAFLAMEKALQIAGISSNEIEYINAHGTATRNNDLSESIAIKRIFEDQIPPLSSTKGFTGHTLAAAGSIEAVYSLLGLRNNQIFPNLNFKNSMVDTGIQPVTELYGKELRHVLSNSFGFGGNCASLVISKHEE